MNTEKKKYYEIVAGPNKDALFDACKYACSKTARVGIEFVIPIGYTMPKDNPGCAYIAMAITDVRIIGIEHEDGSGESFNLHGYCKCDLKSFGRKNVCYRPYRFKAYYNAKNRRGHIVFIDS